MPGVLGRVAVCLGEGVRGEEGVVGAFWPVRGRGRLERARAAVAGAVAGRRRGALCSGLP